MKLTDKSKEMSGILKDGSDFFLYKRKLSCHDQICLFLFSACCLLPVGPDRGFNEFVSSLAKREEKRQNEIRMKPDGSELYRNEAGYI